MIVYKTLDATGASQFQKYHWPVPDGAIPGDWVEEEGDPRLCEKGLHGWNTFEKADREGTSSGYRYIYEMELDDSHPAGIKNDGVKSCCMRARLLRLVQDEHGPVLRMTDYVWQ